MSRARNAKRSENGRPSANEIHARERLKNANRKNPDGTDGQPSAVTRHRHRRHRSHRNSRPRTDEIVFIAARYNCATAGAPRAHALIRENKDLSEPKRGEATMYSTEPVFRGHARLLINLSLVSEERWEARNKIYRWRRSAVRPRRASSSSRRSPDYADFLLMYESNALAIHRESDRIIMLLTISLIKVHGVPFLRHITAIIG